MAASALRTVAPEADECLLRKGFQFGQDGGEKFRNCRMDMHRALYYRIRRLRIHDVQQDLKRLRRRRFRESQRPESVLFPHQQRFLMKPCVSPFSTARPTRFIGCFRSKRSAFRLPYFGVRHPASAQRRVCKQKRTSGFDLTHGDGLR